MSTPSSPPELITEKMAIRSWSRRFRSQGKTLALVPTMGFLHDGHLSLVRSASSLADLVVVSIYVNPGQFAPSEDLRSYPSDLAGDLRKLADLGVVDAVFSPRNLYDYGGGGSEGTERRGGEGRSDLCCVDGDWGHESWIRVERLERGLCGQSRPIFFRGVATIVAKLFNVVEPDFAVFGKKDYQQWRVLCRMVRDLDFAVKIIGSDLVREPDGLAMSSRNVRLSPEERQKALSIYNSLSTAKSLVLNGKTSSQEIKDLVIQEVEKSGGRIDYVEVVEQETLEEVVEIRQPVVICVAAWFGNVRLIDNMEINA